MTKFIRAYENQIKISEVSYIYGKIAEVCYLKLNMIAYQLLHEASMNLHIRWLNPLLPRCRKRLCPIRIS